MAKITVNRVPASVDVPTKYYDTYFNQTSFAGINDNKNDININQQSFADANNVYVDTSERLVSRPPVSLVQVDSASTANKVGVWMLIDEWWFNNVHFLYRYRGVETVDYYLSVTEDMYDDSNDMLVGKGTIDNPPKCVPIPVENKVFFFVENGPFYCYDLQKQVFEDAAQYVYVPINQLLINNIVSEYESKNILTNTYKVRHQLSAVSDIDFQALMGKHLSVNFTSTETKEIDNFLYDVDVKNGLENVLVYPYGASGDYEYDVVETSITKIFLRYNAADNIIQISTNAKYYRTLPQLNDKPIRKPQISKDGSTVFVFLPTKLAKCKIVNDDAEEVSFDVNYIWVYENYFQRVSPTRTIDLSIMPSGVFTSYEHFMYMANTTTDGFNCYIEWPHHDNAEDFAFVKLSSYYLDITSNGTNNAMLFLEPTADDVNKHFFIMSAYEKRSQSSTDATFAYNIFEIYGINKSYNVKVLSANFSTPTLYDRKICKLEDVALAVYQLDTTNKKFSIKAAYSLRVGDENGNAFKIAYVTDNDKYSIDAIFNVTVNYADTTLKWGTGSTEYYNENNASRYFKISADCSTIITDKFVYSGQTSTQLPEISGASLNLLMSKDEISVLMKNALPDKDIILKGNICKLNRLANTTDITAETLNGPILSGDNVVFIPVNNTTEVDIDYILNPYHKSTDVNYDIHIFTIYKMIPNTDGTILIRADNGVQVQTDDYIQLVPFGAISATQTKYIRLKNTSLTNIRTVLRVPFMSGYDNGYDLSKWQQTWTDKGIPPMSNGQLVDGNIQYWRNTDEFPTIGELNNTAQKPIYGVINNVVRKPLFVSSPLDSWYIIGDKIWTNKLTDGVIFNLDELINDNNGAPDIVNIIPSHWSEMNALFISLQNDLFISQTRYKKSQGMIDYSAQQLLYFPQSNGKRFTTNITNLHLLADSQMGIFFADETWLCEPVTINNTSGYLYTKSRLPIGCREGDDIITSIDGQYVIIARDNGISAIQPQQFAATTDQMINILSGTIETMYSHLYKDIVETASIDSSALYVTHLPNIKMLRHKYWHIFYKYYTRTLLLYDLRTGVWWKWTLQYPVRKITDVDGVLNLLLQVDAYNTTYSGVRFIVDTDKQIYKDDLISLIEKGIQSTNGEFTLYTYGDNKTQRVEKKLATDRIDWHFTSQKLHFSAINNYKQIKQLNTICSGDTIQKVKLKTVAYRDITHPEKNIVVENKINDLKTFITRINLIHVQFFQYTIGVDVTENIPTQLQLDALNIKYGVKERIR